MADIDFDDFEAAGGFAAQARGYHPMPRRDPRGDPAAPPLSARLQRLVNAAGALTSVALIGGLGLWGYQLAVRDVTGIPVIRALEGPARVAPAEPGGELALHQGMAVNTVPAEGIAAEPGDSMTLAPKAVGLADEDQPMGAPLPAEAGSPVARVSPVSLPDAASGAPRLTEPLPDGPVDTVQDASGEDGPGADGPDTPATALPASAIAAGIPGVARSPRPAARPAGDAMAEAAAAAVAAALAPPGALDMAPEDLAPGTRLVQIGTFADAGSARSEWDRAAERLGALLDGKHRVIEPAERGGETFYRLRVEGFADIADARRFCDVLAAEGAECVPAQVH